MLTIYSYFEWNLCKSWIIPVILLLFFDFATVKCSLFSSYTLTFNLGVWWCYCRIKSLIKGAMNRMKPKKSFDWEIQQLFNVIGFGRNVKLQLQFFLFIQMEKLNTLAHMVIGLHLLWLFAKTSKEQKPIVWNLILLR